MKTYLNREETVDYLLIVGAIESINNFVEGWKSRGNLTGEESRMLNTAKTNIHKACVAIDKRLDPSMTKKLVKSAMSCTVSLVNSKAFEAERKKANEEEGVWVGRDALDDLADAALSGWCAPCRKAGKERDECRLRECLMASRVPMACENPPMGVCPWDCGGGEK